MRGTLDLEAGWAEQVPTWIEAIRLLRERIDSAGVLVVASGIVGNNIRRKLDPGEFRGFSLVDEYAPLIFVNGADYRSAQMFTLAHELAHVWLDASGVSNPDLADLDAPRPDIEQRCNAIAAEFLIPSDELGSAWSSIAQDPRQFERIARRFKTSQIVAARRAIDIGLIDRSEFFEFLNAYQANPERGARTSGDGGEFWYTQRVRTGRRLSHAIVQALEEARLLYEDAYALTCLRGPTFDKFVERVRENR